MLYREVGQYKTNYAADMAVFPILQDRIGIVVILLIAFLIIPFFGNDFLLNAVMIPFLILALAAIGLNLLSGYCGLLSLGTGAFMGVGAYACLKLTTYFPQVNIVVWIVASGLFSAAVGALFGLPSLRIKGFYLAVATLAAQFFLPTKLLAFAVSSFYCGVAGAMLVFLWYGGAEPDVFNIDQSFLSLFMVIIGGLGSLIGSFFGAALIYILPIALREVPAALGLPLNPATVEQLQFAIFGALVIALLVFEPAGLARLWQIGKQKLRVWPFPY